MPFLEFLRNNFEFLTKLLRAPRVALDLLLIIVVSDVVVNGVGELLPEEEDPIDR